MRRKWVHIYKSLRYKIIQLLAPLTLLPSLFLRDYLVLLTFTLNSSSLNSSHNHLCLPDLSMIYSAYFSWFLIFMISKYTLFSQTNPQNFVSKYSCHQSPGQDLLNHQIWGWVWMCFPEPHLNYTRETTWFRKTSPLHQCTSLPDSRLFEGKGWALMPRQPLISTRHLLVGPWRLIQTDFPLHEWNGLMMLKSYWLP